MAKNREPVIQVESESESGEEDDNGSSGEDDSQESDSESEQTQTPMQNNSAAPPPPPPQPPQQSASSSEEEESGSEAESESEGLDSNDSPVASNGGRSTPTTPLSAKRPAEYTATPSVDAKKTKIDGSEASKMKSDMFQRPWIEEDEILLLKGMLDYMNAMKYNVIASLDDFHDFMKEKLHTLFRKAQLQDKKLKKMYKKFENNNSKEKGKEKSFSKPHEQKAYDLSKIIWADEIGSVVRKTPKKKLNLFESEEENNVKNAVVGGGGGGKPSLIFGGTVEEKMVMMGREFFEAGLGIEGENEWQKMKVMEWELNLKQLQVRVAQTKLVLGGLKVEDH